MNRIHYNYKLDGQTITNVKNRRIKPVENQKQIKLIYYTKFKTSNFIVKNTSKPKLCSLLIYISISRVPSENREMFERLNFSPSPRKATQNHQELQRNKFYELRHKISKRTIA